MVDEQKLAFDEAQRVARYENAKTQAREEVNTELGRQTGQLDPHDQAQLSNVGQRMKQQAVTEIAETDSEVQRARGIARFSQFVDYAFYLIYGIIGLEIVFDLLGARRTNTIREFIDALASPLLAPFKSLLPDPALGRFQFRTSYLIALAIYIMLHLAITGLFRLIAQRKTAI